MKRCPRCGQMKALTDFGLRTGVRDGRHSHCKACVAEKVRQRRAERGTERENRQSAAWARAARRVIDLHRNEFDEIYLEEKAKAGLLGPAVAEAATGGAGAPQHPVAASRAAGDTAGERGPSAARIRDNARVSHHPGVIKNSA